MPYFEYVGLEVAVQPWGRSGCKKSTLILKIHPTVDGQNPAPPRMMIIPFLGFNTSQVVQDVVRQQ